MTKITATLILSVMLSCFSTGAYAKDNEKNMKSLMVQSLSEYGRQLYIRGNYDEAVNVYARILAADPHNDQARKYLMAIKQKGVAVQEEFFKEDVKPLAVIPAPVVVKEQPVPVIEKTLDQDLADLQNDLKTLRETLRAKSQQIQILEKQLPPSL